MKYRIEFYLKHKYDVAYGEFQKEEKLYRQDIPAMTDENAVKAATRVMDDLADYKNRFGLDGEVIARRVSSITRIDQEEITVNIPLP